MGYSTKFSGQFRFDRKPPDECVLKLRGIYDVDTRELDGDYPGFYCQWVLTSSGGLAWDGGEKFENYVEWLQWIIDTILKPAEIKLFGTVSYAGDDAKDAGIIEVGDDQIVVRTETALVGDKVRELREFRDFVLASDWGDEILEAWRDR